MTMTNKRRTAIVLATSAVVLGAGVAAWAQQIEVKKDAWLATTGGNVGVGTTAPNYKLDVAGSVNGTILCIAGVCKTSWPGSGTSSVWSMNGATTYYNGGQVGIGTASPRDGYLLQVDGNVAMGDTPGWGAPGMFFDYIDAGTGTFRFRGIRWGEIFQWGHTASGYSWVPTMQLYNNSLSLYNNNNAPGSITVHFDPSGTSYINGGNVGIGTTSPTYKLQVNGAAAGTSWTNLSSRSYKEQIRRVSKSEQRQMLDALMRMKPSRYKYKPRYGGDGAEHIGFIAEEMPREVLSKNGKGVDVYELQTLTIAALKEQERQIAAQRNQIATQRHQIAAQRGQTATELHQIAAQRHELEREERQIEVLTTASRR